MVSISLRKSTRLAVYLCFGMVVEIATANAQTVAAPEIQRQVDDAFRDVLSKTASTESRLRYAALLVQAGNFEGGIAALEGLLLSPEAPPNIRVELAVLYYRLGSYAMSANYLRDALADPRLDTALRRQAEALLVDVTKRNQPSQFSGSLMIGLRGQSNPTAATSHSNILVSGIAIPRDPKAKAKSDIDTQIWGTLDHTLDLQAQNEATIVTSLIGFANHYALMNDYHSAAFRNYRPYDMAIIAASTGIRFKPSPSNYQNLTLMPKLILGDTLFKEKQYFSVIGVGLEGNNRLNDKVSVGASFEIRDFNYSSRPDIVDANSQDGLEQAFRLRGMIETGVNQFVLTELGYTLHDAKRGYYEYRGPDLKVSYAVSYTNPFVNSGSNWMTTLSGWVIQRNYRSTDPFIALNSDRHDTEWRFSMINAIPLAQDTSLQIQFDYTKNSSNIPNFEYSNFAGTVGVLWKF